MRLDGELGGPRAALAEGFEGAETLHRIEELGAIVGIGTLPRLGGGAVPAVKGGGRHQGKNREAEHRASERQIEKRHEDEDADGRQGGDAELRQILAEIGFQLLDPVDQGEERGR